MRSVLCLQMLCLLSLEANAAVPSSPIDPNNIRGVKWAPLAEAKTGVLDFETSGLEYDEFLDAVRAKGINSIVLKVVDLDRHIPDTVGTQAQKHAKRNAAIERVLRALKSHPKEWHVFLWKRQWFQRKGVDINTLEFEQEMSELINAAKKGGYDDIIEGIMPIETNLRDSPSILKCAVEVPHRINASTGNWLRRKTFMFPGAGMGGYFAGINEAWTAVTLSGVIKQADFFENMDRETNRFSFIVKNMPSQDTKTCPLGRYNATWHELGSIQDAGRGSLAEAEKARKTFLNETMGFRDLVKFLKGGPSEYGNVIYWGDANEGMTENKESMWFHQAWHQLLVTEQGRPGHFTYFISLKGNADVADVFGLRKYLFRSKDANGAKSLEPRGSGWANWQGWPKPDYIIRHTNSSN